MTPSLLAHLAQQHGLFTAAQVRSAGITDDERRHKVRRREWIRIRQGIYIQAETWHALSTLVDRHRVQVVAAQLALDRPSWASGHSAFFVHDELADVITGRLAKIPGIVHTETHIAFRAYSRHDLEAAFSLGL